MKLIILFFVLFFCVLPFYAQEKIQMENLGENVNSKCSEINPIISPDGKVLYFVRCNHPLNTFGEQGSQDIWFSNLGESNKWSMAAKMSLPFNIEQYNGIINITPDGNSVLIRGAFTKGKLSGNGYSFSYKTTTGWSLPEKIKIKNYTLMDVGLTNSACLSNDGKTLLISFSEKYQSMENDLYVSFLIEQDKWSKPLNLGKKINTDSTEASPFLASDGVTLYFASNRKGGFGSSDIYITKRLDDSWTNWSEPVNLGNSINSEGGEIYYSLDAAGKYAYIVSDKNSIGERDIVKILLGEEQKPDPVVLVYGNVYNKKTNEPIEAAITYEKLGEKSEVAGLARSNPETGEYKIILPYGQLYGFSADKKGFMSVSDNIDLRAIEGYTEIKRDLYLVPIEIGQTVRLQNIFFDFAKADLRPESFPELDRVLKLLNENPNMKIEISGHTDSDGSDELNRKLSDNRAISVMNYITSKNISTNRITAKGYGETKPIAENDTDENKQLNRRVEFTVLEK